MARAKLICESTLTDRYQTTIPDTVRKALQLQKRDKISYVIQPDGQILLSRSESHQDDPVLEQFLTLLAQDISQNPQHTTAISTDLYERMQSLVSGVEVDLDAPLAAEDD